MNIFVDKYHPIKDVDLNKIQSYKHYLDPIDEQLNETYAPNDRTSLLL